MEPFTGNVEGTDLSMSGDLIVTGNLTVNGTPISTAAVKTSVDTVVIHQG